MAAEAYRRGAEHIRQLVVLGDGAPWIWNLAAKHIPAATQIVELYHAREHLHELAGMLAFINGNHHTEWLADRLTDLDAGRIEALTNAAYDLPLVGVKATSKPTPTACTTPASATSACSSAPAPSKPAAKPSSANDSNSPACAGPSAAPPASSPCAATKPAAGSTRSGSDPTTRHPQPDRANNRN